MTSLSQFNTIIGTCKRVLMLPEFEKDEPELINGVGEYIRYAKVLERKIKYVDDNIDNPGARNTAEWLEKLQGKEAAGFFKIPISGKGQNYRIILCFKRDNDKRYAILLHSFKEKDDKAYVRAIKVARKRYVSYFE